MLACVSKDDASIMYIIYILFKNKPISLKLMDWTKCCYISVRKEYKTNKLSLVMK